MKLKQLKTMIKSWQKTRSVTIATDICEFLAQNLNLEDDNEA